MDLEETTSQLGLKIKKIIISTLCKWNEMHLHAMKCYAMKEWPRKPKLVIKLRKSELIAKIMPCFYIVFFQKYKGYCFSV